MGPDSDDSYTLWGHPEKMMTPMLTGLVMATTVPHFGPIWGPNMTTVTHFACPIFAFSDCYTLWTLSATASEDSYTLLLPFWEHLQTGSRRAFTEKMTARILAGLVLAKTDAHFRAFLGPNLRTVTHFGTIQRK